MNTVKYQPAWRECDYDANPSVLYQAIEAKQWGYALSLFTQEEQKEEASTWVTRKETSGRLRWRLLPLHAAVIFGSPLKLVELLLADCPTAAQSKDDQGMLPLHLAFRNEASWEVIEELLTAFPQAVFVSDRKGRTPLQYGERSVSSSSSNGSPSAKSKSFKAAVSVLDLFSQIAISGERNRVQEEERKLADARMTQMHDSHVATLTSLKKEMQKKEFESKAQLAALQEEKRALEEIVATQQIDLTVYRTTEKGLKDRLHQLSLGSDNDNEKANGVVTNETLRGYQRTNEVLRGMVENLVAEQKDYNVKYTELMDKYEKLAEERKKVQEIFMRESQSQIEKEAENLEQLKKWLNDKEKKLSDQEMLLEGETKRNT